MFGGVNVVINSDKSKCAYSGWEIGFGGADSLSFGNNFARNVILGLDSNSWCRTNNRKNIFYF